MSAAVTFAKRLIADLEASGRADSSSTRDLLKALVTEIEELQKKLVEFEDAVKRGVVQVR